jgi:citrate lyase beta subunit
MITSSPTQPTSLRESPPVPDLAQELPQGHVVAVAVVGGVGVVVAGSGALGYRIYDNAALDPGAGRAYDPWQHWRDNSGPLGAVSAAILAADPDSTEPWVFEMSASSIDIYADATLDAGSIDPFKREQYVGLGAALENLVLACRARGLEPMVELLPDGPNGARAAHVRLSPNDPQPSPLYDAIGQRHGDRVAYESRPMPAEMLSALVDADGLDGVTVAWVTHPVHTDELRGLLDEAAAALARDAHGSRAGFAWFRQIYGAVARHRRGLPRDAEDQRQTATAYGVITAADAYDRATQLVAGRLLQRIHLTATGQGSAVQPVNEITERIDRERASRKPATLGRRFGELLPAGAEPVVIFRFGHPTSGAIPRLPVTAATR